MKIRDVFRNPIDRRIEEVIKVDLGDDETVAYELGEYHVTNHIRNELTKLFDSYQESINKPNESTNIWISGFFGSGKSSFAKVLGYLLSNPIVLGQPAADRFFERFHDDRLRALLAKIQEQAPTLSVFVDLSSAKNVAREGESVVLPLYRAVLERFNYSRDFTLADLEFDLESDGDLEDFEEAFAKVSGERGTWQERRNIAMARSEASHALHLLRPDTYTSPDSWARSVKDPVINADFFAERVVEMAGRRDPQAKRLLFVVDEVGQYVARTVDRMFDLMGLAHAVQKKRGRLWLAVTSQEKLEDVVDSLEGKKVELARVRDRFPSELEVDLIPSDIEEVVSRRVLDKNAEGAATVRVSYRAHRHKFLSNVALDSPTRQREFSEEEFVRLYPLLPYQIQLFIDAVSAHRARGGVSPMLGGSNRTIIKLAQQFVVNQKTRLGERDVGALATADMAYELLESIIPTSWQAEVDSVAARHGTADLATRVVKGIALLTDVPALKLTPVNVAAVLHPSVEAESLKDQTAETLQMLVTQEVLRQTEDGYKLQSPEEKDWEKERRGIDMRPAAFNRIKREAAKQLLEGLAVESERTFRVGVAVNGDRVAEGDLEVAIDESESGRRDQVRSRSREKPSVLFWAFEPSGNTSDAAIELHRSSEMLKRREGAARSATDVELLGEERMRLARHERAVRERLASDLLAGSFFFDGVDEEPRNGDPRNALREALTPKVSKIYPRLKEFAAPAKTADALTLLRADSLDGVPPYLTEDGIGVVRSVPEGAVLALDREPLSVVLETIRERAGYGVEASGKYLGERFAAPPFGAPVDVVRVLVAALMRAGAVEAIYQGARIANPKDSRLDRVFGTLPGFRSTTFVPSRDVDPDMRARVAKRIQETTGEKPSIAADQLAVKIRDIFRPHREAMGRVSASLSALGLETPEAVERARGLIDAVLSSTDEDAIKTCDESWADLVEGGEVATKLERILDPSGLQLLREAREQVRLGPEGLGPDAAEAVGQLADLLTAGDIASHVGTIRGLLEKARKAREAAWQSAAEALRSRVNEEAERLSSRFGAQLETSVLQEALRPLRDLAPREDASLERGPGLETLGARLSSVDAVSGRVAGQLGELASKMEVVRVRLRDLYEGVVSSEEELEALLERIRRAAEEALAQGKGFQLS